MVADSPKFYRLQVSATLGGDGNNNPNGARKLNEQKEFVKNLNENFVPDVNAGKVTLLFSFEVDGGYDEREATAEELKNLGFKSGCVEEHPEGSDRGGYVPTVESVHTVSLNDSEFPVKAYYDENGGVWNAC